MRIHVEINASMSLAHNQFTKNKPLFETALVSTLILNVVTAFGASPIGTHMSGALHVIRKNHDLPAPAMVAANDGHSCDRAAVGVRKFGDPAAVTTNDMFHIGSCTKPMTATLTAMLIEEGKLHWNTTIAELFPELAGRMDKQYGAVTVEQLLTHRGGVP